MSTATRELGRGRGPQADDVAGSARPPAAGKQTRAAELAKELAAPAREDEALEEEAGLEADEEAGGEAGGEAGAGAWDMTAGLSAAMGLDVGGDGEGAATEARPATPVRRKASASSWANEAPAGDDQAIARAGFTGSPAADFPHRGAIEQSFGAPLPATAYTGGAAAQASSALGADGYALGHQVGFASAAPSLELAAHEAAHVMQATTGVQLHGGSGAHEDHADAVAARVVRGESAADLLTAGPVATPEVRRGKNKGEERQGRSKGKQQGKGKGRGKQREQARPREPATTDHQPKSSARFIKRLAHELKVLIHKAQWSEIRKAAYPQESRAGIVRAKQREKGKLPELTGLGKLSTLRTFAQAMKDIHSDWANLSAPQRTNAIFQAINHEMGLAGVPAFRGIDLEDGNLKGAFYGAAWKIQIGKAIIEGPAPSEPDARDLCNTVLHEARHAEQNFLAARFAAGPPHDLTADEIADSHGIPHLIAQQAVLQAFDRGTDETVAALGKQMYQAFVTDGAKNQHISDDDYLQEMGEARTAASDARLALIEEGSQDNIATATSARDTLKDAMAEVERRYTLYRNIPYEKDAHDVGDAVELIYKDL